MPYGVGRENRDPETVSGNVPRSLPTELVERDHNILGQSIEFHDGGSRCRSPTKI